MRDIPALRTAITAIFAFAGFTTASWAVRIPDISAQVGASHAALGGALLFLSLGALATMRLTGALVERLGAGLTTALAAFLVSVTVVPPGLVRSVTGLGVVLIAFGAATGALNVAMNSVGIRLEAALRRPVLPFLHAGFSFGALAGSVAGGVLAGSVPPAPHLLAVAGAGLLTAAVLARPLLAADDRRTPALGVRRAPARSSLSGVRTTVAALGVIAGCTAFAEGALSDWATLHLSEDLHAPAVLAAAGYAGFSLAMACGRLAGHRLLRWWGETRLLVVGCLAAAGGMLAAALTSSVPVALTGMVAVGLGLANVFPVTIARAGALAGSHGVGLASTIGYGGMLLGPAVIGFVATRAGLPLALATVSGLAVTAAVLSAAVATGRPALSRSPVLPWTQAEVTARLRAVLAPARAAVGSAAQRHADSLRLLSPEPVRAHHASPRGDLATVFAPDTLLGPR